MKNKTTLKNTKLMMNLLTMLTMTVLLLIFISCSDSKNNNSTDTGQIAIDEGYDREKCVVEGRKKVALCVPQYKDIIEKNKIKKIVECNNGEWIDLTPCYETYLTQRRERKKVDGDYGLNYTYTYDENMILQSHIIKSALGDKIRDVTYEYNRYGDIIKITEEKNNKPQKIIRYELYYNASNIINERVEYITTLAKEDREYKTRKYKAVLFADSNKPKREIIQVYNPEGYLIQEQVYYYNKFGDITEFNLSDTSKFIKGKKDFSKRQEIVELFNKHNELLYKEVAIFNDEGDDLNIIVTNALDEKVYEWEMKVNTMDKKEWIQSDNQGIEMGYIKAQLGTNGNQIAIDGKEKYINVDLKIVNLSYNKAYKFDEKGFLIIQDEPPVDVFDYQFKLFDYIYIER